MQEDTVTLRSCNTRKLMKEIEGKRNGGGKQTVVSIDDIDGYLA